MPVYFYHCNTCGQVFEEKLSFRDAAAAVRCPQGHSDTRRVFTPPSIVFKGKGFYVTDHRAPRPTGD